MQAPVDENGQTLTTALIQMNVNVADPADADEAVAGGHDEQDGAVAPIPPANPVHGVLAVCGISTNASRQTFIDVERLNSIDAFATLNGNSDVTEIAKRMAARTANTGRVILGTMQIKKIQALVYWVKDHHKRNSDVDPHAWTELEVMSTMQRKEADQNFEKVDVDIIDPGAHVPDAADRREFQKDNKYVYNILKAACVKTDAWTWIQDHDGSANGRKAWRALVTHYDGVGELNKRVERAKEEINRLHYKDEKSFPFERYVTKLKENFYILVKDKDERLTERQRVDVFLKGIRSTNPSIVAAKTDVYKDYRAEFDAATNFMSGLISNIHAGAQIDYANRHSGKQRYVSAVGSSDSGRGGRGRTRRGGGRYDMGRGGRGRDARGRGRGTPRKTYINNVDVTDPHRNFTADEWDRLGSLRSYILQMRGNASGRGRDGRGAGRGNDAGLRNASSASATTNEPIPTAQNATNANDHQSVVSEMTERGSKNGRSFGRGAYT